MLKWDGWYYMFYIGFIHVDRAAIGLARSKDGITGWERYSQNPIIAPDKGKFDEKAVYKPYVMKMIQDGSCGIMEPCIFLIQKRLYGNKSELHI